MVVGRIRSRLDDERIRAAYVLKDLDENLSVGKAGGAGFGQRQVHPFGDGLRQHGIGISGDQLDRAVLGRHRRFSSRLAAYDVQRIEKSSGTGEFRAEWM